MAQNYVLLERIELNASASSVTFSNIPQSGYTDLKVVVSARISAAVEQGFLICQPNSATTNLSSTILYGFGNNQGSSSYSVEQSIWSYINGSSSTSNTFSNNEIYIPNYNSSSAYKSVSVDGVNENNATNARQSLTAGLWSSNTAISSVKLYPTDGGFTASSFLQYSTFSLYGLAAVGTTPAIAPKASGGNITTDGTYWYHTFLSTGTFTPAVALTCDALVVGGGSSGVSYYGGGGGGAGGIATATQSLTATTYAVTIGAGGTAVSYSSNANAGNNTTFAGTSNVIGYAGVAGVYTSGGAGGWGYGGTSGAPQSNAGGSSYVYSGGYNEKGGGGGGAGGAGTTPSFSAGGAAGNGGAGLNTWSTWATATGTGVSGYYAGGGAGGGARDTTAGTAGSGGGGAAGANGAAGNPATANTGSGGGGAGGNANSGAGGSGIVIIRYTIA